MMRYGDGFGPAGLLWSLFGFLVVVGLVVLIIWALSRSTNRVSSSGPDRTEALEILRLRYARGEITEAEFVQAKKVLGYER
jgi:putative membrane protein